MCHYFKNFYIYSTCREPAAHIIKTNMDDESKEPKCSDSPHDRFIVVVGLCLLCR
ncbi:hypothetical protein BO70DRAFT_363310 [Aspergillus heteromorphus CBS 117.55]|uniref:Uncharacterized protein n=1 Tax=Aspergillus heteromorphus CBS 117.55 TaxID=1448321 RepID=A0A317VWU1_9EURO|nr:uncharacterized protein BO70DRAFT_363310 [Aspergillus heteromorphus CBS 117.55]PWY77368.1 hypothetical protein BO70DRAFT_363310 [Aspergillus heteromorphus CBS 117.55]